MCVWLFWCLKHIGCGWFWPLSLSPCGPIVLCADILHGGRQAPTVLPLSAAVAAILAFSNCTQSWHHGCCSVSSFAHWSSPFCHICHGGYWVAPAVSIFRGGSGWLQRFMERSTRHNMQQVLLIFFFFLFFLCVCERVAISVWRYRQVELGAADLCPGLLLATLEVLEKTRPWSVIHIWVVLVLKEAECRLRSNPWGSWYRLTRDRMAMGKMSEQARNRNSTSKSCRGQEWRRGVVVSLTVWLSACGRGL